MTLLLQHIAKMSLLSCLH